MGCSCIRRNGLVPVALATSFLVGAACGPAVAEGCFSFKAPIDRSAVDLFRADPKSIFDVSQTSSADLTVKIRNLVMLSPEETTTGAQDAPSPVFGIFSTATAAQKAVIAAGLAAAADACTTTHPELAFLIQQNVILSDDPGFMVAFRTASLDITTASLGSATGTTATAAIGTGVGPAGLSALDAPTTTESPAKPAAPPTTVVRTVTRTFGSSVSPSSIGGP